MKKMPKRWLPLRVDRLDDRELLWLEYYYSPDMTLREFLELLWRRDHKRAIAAAEWWLEQEPDDKNVQAFLEEKQALEK